MTIYFFIQGIETREIRTGMMNYCQVSTIFKKKLTMIQQHHHIFMIILERQWEKLFWEAKQSNTKSMRVNLVRR